MQTEHPGYRAISWSISLTRTLIGQTMSFAGPKPLYRSGSLENGSLRGTHDRRCGPRTSIKTLVRTSGRAGTRALLRRIISKRSKKISVHCPVRSVMVWALRYPECHPSHPTYSRMATISSIFSLIFFCLRLV